MHAAKAFPPALMARTARDVRSDALDDTSSPDLVPNIIDPGVHLDGHANCQSVLIEFVDFLVIRCEHDMPHLFRWHTVHFSKVLHNENKGARAEVVLYDDSFCPHRVQRVEGQVHLDLGIWRELGPLELLLLLRYFHLDLELLRAEHRELRLVLRDLTLASGDKPLRIVKLVAESEDGLVRCDLSGAWVGI